MTRKQSRDNDIIINGLNIDDWLDEDNKVGNDEIDEISTLRYEKKLVAFLDLLGITEQVRSMIDGNEEEIISKMEKIKGIVEKEIQDIGKDDIQMLYISDSFIFVCEKDILPNFLKLLSNIQMRILVECKTMLRGSVEYGDVIIRDQGKQIIGPAYISAYINQEKYAIYPRIILSASVVEIISEYDQTIISQDREYSLDYFDVYKEIEGKSTRDLILRLKREGVFKYLCDDYKKYSEKNNLSVKSKYAWTINYLKNKGVWPNEKQYNCW